MYLLINFWRNDLFFLFLWFFFILFTLGQIFIGSKGYNMTTLHLLPKCQYPSRLYRTLITLVLSNLKSKGLFSFDFACSFDLFLYIPHKRIVICYLSFSLYFFLMIPDYEPFEFHPCCCNMKDIMIENKS